MYIKAVPSAIDPKSISCSLIHLFPHQCLMIYSVDCTRQSLPESRASTFHYYPPPTLPYRLPCPSLPHILPVIPIQDTMDTAAQTPLYALCSLSHLSLPAPLPPHHCHLVFHQVQVLECMFSQSSFIPTLFVIEN